MIHEQGLVITKLNGKKGIWCEVCGVDCKDTHLITVESRKPNLMYQHACVQCTQDIVACLKLSLMDALLTDKEIP